MTRVCYVDTSAIACLLFGEAAAAAVRATLAQFERRFAANFLAAELAAAARREQIPAAQVTPFLGAVSWLLPNRDLQPEIDEVQAAGALRSGDLWHVACALYLERLLVPVTLVTLDERQREVAAAVGLSVA